MTTMDSAGVDLIPARIAFPPETTSTANHKILHYDSELPVRNQKKGRKRFLKRKPRRVEPDEDAILSEIRERMASVELKYSSGSYDVSLGEGRTADDGKAWSINLDTFSIPLDEVSSLQMIVSGTTLNIDNVQTTVEGKGKLIDIFYTCHDGCVSLFGEFEDEEDLVDVSCEDFREVFFEAFYNVFRSQRLRSTLKLRVLDISFSLY